MTMSFIHSNCTLFVASVGENNVALLDGKTKIQAESLPSHSANAAASTTSYEIWHKCLAHIGHDRLAKQNLVDALTVELPSNSPLCESCIDGKQKCFPFSHTATWSLGSM